MPKSVSDVLAERVKHFRDARNLSVAKLAALIAELDPETTLTPAALANIERKPPEGKPRARRRVSVDELLTLAYVLQVPPLALVAPVGFEEAVEPVYAGGGRAPGGVPPMALWEWIAGISTLPDADGETRRNFASAAHPVRLQQDHDRLTRHLSELGGWPQAVMHLEEKYGGSAVPERELREAASATDTAVTRELRQVRRAMEALGMRVPDVPDVVTLALRLFEEPGRG